MLFVSKYVEMQDVDFEVLEFDSCMVNWSLKIRGFEVPGYNLVRARLPFWMIVCLCLRVGVRACWITSPLYITANTMRRKRKR